MDDSGAKAGPELSAEEWELAKDLVYEGQLENPQDLNAWLDARCSSPPIRREVERLLRSAATCGNFLEQPASNQYFGVSRTLPARIGRYRVIEEIGAGGMGVVYAAYDEELNRRVAIKVLLAQTAEDPELRKRLRWDAQAASALQHPNIVTVHEVGSDGGSDYVAMECISGKTLGRLIPAGGMETADALRCAVQIASGLEAAHLAGIVHRDLKPSNIMITESGVVKLLDFGLAKGLGASFNTGDAPSTIEGKFAGTVAYVSPEQAEGKAVDVRSDVFSFGSVLFEMLTGRRAFPGDSGISVLADILHNDPPAATELHPQMDPRLNEIVQRCLRKNRARRFQSIGEVKIRLQEIEEEAQYAKMDRSAAQTLVGRQPWRGIWYGVAIGALATAALAVGLFLAIRKPAAETGRNITLTRATSDVGLTEFPALSRDNQFLAYASDRSGDGNLHIWIQPVKGSESLQRTSNAAADSAPVFSPDGTKLLFRSDREGGGLYLIPAHGGGLERPIATQGRGGQFSPDGKLVAFWLGELGSNLYEGSARISIVPASGGVAKPFQPDFPAAAYPVWAAGGDRLLFLARERGDGPPEVKVDWWIASIDGTYKRRTHLIQTFAKAGLRAPPGSDWIAPAAWLASRGRVLFSASHGDAANVWVVGLTEDGVVSEMPRRYTAGTTLELHPSATEVDGGLSLAYETVAAIVDIWRIPLNARGEASGEAGRLISGYNTISSPSISADGSLAVFASHLPDGQAIHMADLKTGKQQTVAVVKTRQVARPVLSGDGAKVAYWDAGARDGYIMHVPNGVPERICESCGPPTYVGLDGRDVLFESKLASDQMWICTEGKPRRPLIQWSGTPSLRQRAGRLSPGRRWVVFSGSPMGSTAWRVWIAPVREEGAVKKDELIPISDEQRAEPEPYWSPDGRTIYFLSNRDGFLCIWARHVDPLTAQPRGAMFPVAHFHRARQTIQSPSQYRGDIGLSASRDSLVFMMADRTGNIWLQAESSRVR